MNILTDRIQKVVYQSNFSGKLRNATKSDPCPICGKTDWCYIGGNNELVGCRRETVAPLGWRITKNQPNDGTTQFALNTGSNADWEARKAEWEATKTEREKNRAEADRQVREKLLTAEQRDPLIRGLAAELRLTAEHQFLLRERGFSDAQIKAGLFFSIEQWQKVPGWTPLNLPGVYLGKFGDKQLNGKGIAIVMFDQGGLATGWQIMNDEPRPAKDDPAFKEYAKYIWAINCKLPIGEMPIQVTRAGEGDPWLCEGGLKSRLAAYKHSLFTIGAAGGQFKASPTQTEAALDGFDKVIIPIDAGDIINSARVRHWTKEIEWLQAIGKEVSIAWWGQKTKDADDIDELASLQKIEYLSAGKWLEKARFEAKKAQDMALYRELSICTHKPDQQRHEADLQPLPMPRVDCIQFISSGVATGKTKQLVNTIDNWQRVYPNSRILMIGYRNGLLDNAGERLGFPSYRVGSGQDDTAIATYPKLRICLDSLLRLKLEDIPSNSLVLLDEVEAILEHGASGGTLGGNTAAIQAHLLAIMHQMLGKGGAVIGLEDNITDISIDGLQKLTGGRYPIELISNSFERFNWEVQIGNSDQGTKIAYILNRLAAGERVGVPTTSQRFGEILERVVLARMPHIKITRLDAKTSPDLSELKNNPDKWLAENQPQLFIYNSVVESGFSIERYQFDRVIGNFTNLTIRTQIQLLARIRSNCPRDIFITPKGAEASSGLSTDPQKIFNTRKSVADRTSLQLGQGKIELSSEGEAWNWIDCQFAARRALSAKYQAELLEAELVGRGHKVEAADWGAILAAQILESGGDFIPTEELKADYKAFRSAIENEENHILYKADGKAITPAQAAAILHSTDSTFPKRQQAKKRLLHEDLPGAELTEEFLMETVTRARGAYLQSCTLAFMVAHPRLANLLDTETFAAQKLQPHIVYKRVPKIRQKVDLLALIADQVADLASGREYKEDDPAVVAVQDIAIKNSYLFWALFGLHIKAEGVDSDGRKINTAIATTNKILKKLGYKSKVIGKEGARGEQVRIWAVQNGNCPHRQTICEALERKYSGQLETLAQREVVTSFNSVETYIKNVTTVTFDTKYSPPDIPIHSKDADLQAIAESLRAVMAGTAQEIAEGMAAAREIWGEDVDRAMVYVQETA